MDSVVMSVVIVALVIFFKMITILVNLKGRPNANQGDCKNKEKVFHFE